MKLNDDQIKRISFSVGKRQGKGDKIVLIATAGIKEISVSEKNFNIYCINEGREIIWQVSTAIPPKFETDTFVYLEEREGRILADRFGGDEFELDMNTGVAHHTGWHK